MLLADVSAAQAQTRSLKLYFVHTREKAEIVYKRNGRFDQAGLKRINQFLRDWRRNEPTRMDPRLLDVVWETYRQSGSRAYIHVVSAYRSPATNNMLRGRSRGVAKTSQHMLGKAMDWYVPDVPLKKLRDIGLRLGAGGVGYYPRSGSPFVHFDVGRVRHWPGISRSELARVFPKGGTLHVPSDGKPLPGYEMAMAAYQSRQKSGMLADPKYTAGGGSARKGGGLLAWFRGGGADQEEDDGESAMPAAKAKPAPRAKPAPQEPQIAIRSPDEARPASREPEIRVLSPDEAAPAGRRAPEQFPNAPAAAPEAPLPEETPVADETSPETVVAGLTARNAPRPMFAQRARPAEELDEPLVAAVVPTQRPSAAVDQIEAMAEAEPAAAEQTVAAVEPPRPAAAPRNQTTARVKATKPAETLADQGWQTGPAPLRTAAAEPPVMEPLALAPRPSVPVGKLPPGWQTGPQGVALEPGKTNTATKTGRVKAGRAKPAAKAQVVEAEATAFATGQDVTAAVRPKVDVPAQTGKKSARAAVRTAPDAVYSAGFQKGAAAQDPNRFSGKAVEFQPVTKFKAN